jgi:preprotein translocase subunit SecA
MDYLREGINLRAMGQQDPLVAWQREGFEMFGRMIDGIDDDYLRYVMHVQVVSQPAEEPDLTQASYQAAEDPLEGPSLLDVFRATAAERASLGDGNAVPVGVGPGTSGDGAGHEASRAVGAAGPSRPAGPVTANVGRDGRTPRTARPADPDAQAPLVKSPSEKLGRNEKCWCGSGKKFKLCHGGS